MDGNQAKTRLDSLLVERRLFSSRSRARDAVLRGAVYVGGMKAEKAGQLVEADALLSVQDAAQAYVSRAALKLIAALDGFGLNPAGCHAADIGCSTGGFCQVLLERGAADIVAVDVGHGQMDAGLRADKRIKLYEGVNARNLTGEYFPVPPDFIVSDVSFISLKLALPPALALALRGAEAALLVKPQFEAGRAAIGKGGLVAPEIAEAAARDLSALARPRADAFADKRR